jgi:hypothetical protein
MEIVTEPRGSYGRRPSVAMIGESGMRSTLRRVLLALLPPLVIDIIRCARRGTKAQQPMSPPPAGKTIAEDGGVATSSLPAGPPEWEMVPDTNAAWTAHAGWAHESNIATWTPHLSA